jgi:hypothetical protein
MKTTTTDGRTYLAGFDRYSTAPVANVVLGPDGEVESQWPNSELSSERATEPQQQKEVDASRLLK